MEVEASLKVVKGAMAEIFSRDFDPVAVVPGLLPPVVAEQNGGPVKIIAESDTETEREIVLGKNVHTTCLAVTEPEANDEFTGDKEAYMAGVLARYRKTLVERTKHHLGIKH